MRFEKSDLDEIQLGGNVNGSAPNINLPESNVAPSPASPSFNLKLDMG